MVPRRRRPPDGSLRLDVEESWHLTVFATPICKNHAQVSPRPFRCTWLLSDYFATTYGNSAAANKPTFHTHAVLPVAGPAEGLRRRITGRQKKPRSFPQRSPRYSCVAMLVP